MIFREKNTKIPKTPAPSKKKDTPKKTLNNVSIQSATQSIRSKTSNKKKILKCNY